MLENAMIVPVYHQKKRQKLHQLATKSNDRRSPHGDYLIIVLTEYTNAVHAK
jgi:hypothetical protein